MDRKVTEYRKNIIGCISSKKKLSNVTEFRKKTVDRKVTEYRKRLSGVYREKKNFQM